MSDSNKRDPLAIALVISAVLAAFVTLIVTGHGEWALGLLVIIVILFPV